MFNFNTGEVRRGAAELAEQHLEGTEDDQHGHRDTEEHGKVSKRSRIQEIKDQKKAF
jgi:hypothetical protein